MVKPLQKSSSPEPKKAYDLETWYVAFGNWAHHNLYKSGLCIDCDLIYGKVNFDALENA